VAPKPSAGDDLAPIPLVDDEAALKALLRLEEKPRAAPAMTDDDLPYQVAGGPDRKCPSCTLVVTEAATHCERCGADLVTGKKPPKTYEPLERRWEAGLPLGRRLRIFLLAQAVFILEGLLGAWLLGSPAVFLAPWLIFTVLLTVLLGTYDRIDVTRDERGRVVLTKTWRICFREREPVRIRLREYEGVTIGQKHDVDFWDWLGVACWLPFGVVPAIVWWFYAFNQSSFYVALTREHGYAATVLYQGWNEEQAKEIAKVMCDVGELPAAD
jgi:hypothetical protein